MDTPYRAIARIGKAHGLQGEVTAVPLVDLPFERLAGIRVWLVPPLDASGERRIAGVRRGPKGPLVAFEPALELETARRASGATMLAAESDLPDWPSGPAWDPLGTTVVDEERGDLGTVTDVIVTGANDVWVVRGRFGAVLIPVIDDVVRALDTEARTARVHLLPGLLGED